MSTILNAALGYVDRCGAWPIIPIVPGNKRPAIRTGIDHAEGATIDLDVLADLHRRGLLQAIGTPTGAVSGTVVIDVDAKHDGEALLAELEHPDVLGPLPKNKVVRTRSGGLHIYCAHPGNGIRVRSAGPKGELAKLLCNRPGIDVRGDGGLVVLPPSLGYTWLADDDEPLEPLPKLWLLAINGAGKPPAPKMVTIDTAISDDRRRLPDRQFRATGWFFKNPGAKHHAERHKHADRKVTRARAYLAKMSPAISGSGGHDALWAAVLAMRIGFDLDESTAKTLIATDFNPRCDPPWDERDIDHKLDGVERAEKSSERGYLLRDNR